MIVILIGLYSLQVVNNKKTTLISSVLSLWKDSDNPNL